MRSVLSFAYSLVTMLLVLVVLSVPTQATTFPDTFLFEVDLHSTWIPQVQYNSHELVLFRASDCLAVLYFSQQPSSYVHIRQAAYHIVETLAGPGGLTRFFSSEDPTYFSWLGRDGLRFSYSYEDENRSVEEERWIFLVEDVLVSVALGVTESCMDEYRIIDAVAGWRWRE